MKVFHLAYDFCEFDSRILKELKTVSKLKEIRNVVLLTSLNNRSLPHTSKLSKKAIIKRLNVYFYHFKTGSLLQIIPFLYWHILVVIQGFKKKPSIVHCHNTETLLAGGLIKLFIGSKLIYDAHELETERGEPRYLLWYFYIIENVCLGIVDRVITVNNSIKEEYKNTYPYLIGKMDVIRNIPIYVPPKSVYKLKEKYNVKRDQLLFGFIGMLGSSRNIDMLLKVFADINHQIVFVGKGPKEKMIKKYASNYQNIHHHPFVKMNKISSITSEFDVGLSLTSNSSKNAYLSLPNKLFEYIHGGTPVIVSDFPEMSAIIRKYNCGWMVRPAEESIRYFLNQINDNDLKIKSKNARNARNELRWYTEEKVLKKIYFKIINKLIC